MRAHMLTATVFSLGAAFAFATSAMSADLPQSGTIKVHSTLKGNSQIVDVGEKHIMGAGNGWGVTFNDAGSGLLHMGASGMPSQTTGTWEWTGGTGIYNQIKGSNTYSGHPGYGRLRSPPLICLRVRENSI